MSTLPLEHPSIHFARRAEVKAPLTSTFARALRACAEREQLDLSDISSPEPAAQAMQRSAAVGTQLLEEQESGIKQESPVPNGTLPVTSGSPLNEERKQSHKEPDQLGAQPVAQASLKVQLAAPIEKNEIVSNSAQPEQVLPSVQASVQSTSGLLSRGWAWLKKNNRLAGPRQLRVTDTVSLGEKRFVSVVEVEGEKFLIGGSSSGITLLTPLGAKAAKSEALRALELAAEQQR